MNIAFRDRHSMSSGKRLSDRDRGIGVQPVDAEMTGWKPIPLIPHPMARLFLCAWLIGGLASASGLVSAQESVDCSKIAFNPDRWRDAGLSFQMSAWQGEAIVFLSRPGDYDSERMMMFVNVLDRGWKVYLRLVGKNPGLHRHLNQKPTICAVPDSKLTCGYGCGYVGTSGIEVAGFYNTDWPQFVAHPDVFSHYYFYEMGRNFFVFGDRHNLFTTGYAVFMRRVCMDSLGLKDADGERTRQVIESCEEIYSKSHVKFLDAFTNVSIGEKAHRLKDEAGRTIYPSDQPVMYASAMHKLRKHFGGERWVRKFLYSLHQCKEFPATDEASAMSQCLNWFVCASKAAGKDLTPVFRDRWRMPLSEKQLTIIREIDWSDGTLPVASVVDRLLAANS